MEKIKTAIVGCGMISNIYAVNLKEMFSIIDLAACADISIESAERTAKRHSIEKAMTVDEVMADPEIEMIINLTTPAAHYEVTKKALEAGKHVYSEKTLAVTVEQGRELVSIAKEKGLYLGGAPDTFLGAGIQTAKYLLDAGMIGDVTSCIAAVNRNHVLNSEFYGFIKNPGGGMAFDVGVYYVTALLALLGPVRTVSGISLNHQKTRKGTQMNRNYGQEWELKSRNLAAGTLLFENGVIGSIHFNGESINEQQPHIAIYGTEGIMYLGDPNNYNGYVRILRKNSEILEFPFTHGFDGVHFSRPASEFDSGQQRGLGAVEMAWAIRKGRAPRASKELCMHTLEILCGLDQASDTGMNYNMETTFERPAGLPKGYVATEGWLSVDQEIALAE